MYMKCKKCKKILPEYLVGKYPGVFLNPICPACALKLTNLIKGTPPGTPFEREADQESLLEAEEFLIVQNKKNWGGHMINPPEECPWAFKQPDEGVWVDLGNCNLNCKDRCIRSYQWKRLSVDERKEELFDNGVIHA